MVFIPGFWHRAATSLEFPEYWECLLVSKQAWVYANEVTWGEQSQGGTGHQKEKVIRGLGISASPTNLWGKERQLEIELCKNSWTRVLDGLWVGAGWVGAPGRAWRLWTPPTYLALFISSILLFLSSILYNRPVTSVIFFSEFCDPVLQIIKPEVTGTPKFVVSQAEMWATWVSHLWLTSPGRTVLQDWAFKLWGLH